MRFMTMIKTTEGANTSPSPEFLAAMGELIQEMVKAGVVVDTGGLSGSADSSRVRISGGKLTVTDGPFTEAKELVAGYAVVDVESREVAVRMAERMMQLHIELWESWEGECEVRQIFGPQDSA